MTIINHTTKKVASLEVNDNGELLISSTGGSGDPPATEATLQSIDTNVSAISDTLDARLSQPTDTDANPLPVDFDTLPQTLGYSTGKLVTIAVTNGVNTWTQTFGYTGTDLTSISGWVKT